jgi:multicomponent Na+:H+ antiporter subunit C
MEQVLAVVVGVLYAAAFYLMLRRSLVKLLLGLVLLGHASNLLIFTAGGLTRANPPIVPEGAAAPVPLSADPLPQALILTAIVIGFGVMAFAIALLRRTFEAAGMDDLDRLRSTDR